MRYRPIAVVTAAGLALALAVAANLRAQPTAEEARRIVDLAYRLTVTTIPVGTADVAAWVPIPPTTRGQRLESMRVSGDWPQAVVREQEYGNQFLRLDLSGAPRSGRQSAEVTVVYRVERAAYRVSDTNENGASLSDRELVRFLAPDALIPIDGRIAEEARQIAGGAEDPLERARLLYDHIVATLTYDRSGEGWGRGDALYACDMRAGNCTDFHSLFIGEARALGIPARFVMGVSLPEDEPEGELSGYHCWGEFYVAGRGWIPIDAAEANKHPGKKELFFGGLDEHRVEFTLGRDIRVPGANSGPLNYVIWPHVEVDGQPHSGVETRLSFRDVS